jgi:hypothetical protein
VSNDQPPLDSSIVFTKRYLKKKDVFCIKKKEMQWHAVFTINSEWELVINSDQNDVYLLKKGCSEPDRGSGPAQSKCLKMVRERLSRHFLIRRPYVGYDPPKGLPTEREDTALLDTASLLMTQRGVAVHLFTPVTEATVKTVYRLAWIVVFTPM